MHRKLPLRVIFSSPTIRLEGAPRQSVQSASVLSPEGVATFIPSALLNKLYTVGSLKNTETGTQFAIKNRLTDATLIGIAQHRN